MSRKRHNRTDITCSNSLYICPHRHPYSVVIGRPPPTLSNDPQCRFISEFMHEEQNMRGYLARNIGIAVMQVVPYHTSRARARLSGFCCRGSYFAWIVKPSKVGFTTHRGSKSQVKWGCLLLA